MPDIHEPPDHEMYSWLDRPASPIGDGSLIFVKSLPADEVLRRLGADPAAAQLLSGEERANRGDAPELTSVHSLGGTWTLAFEPGGFDAFTEKPVRRLSVGTEVVMFNRDILAHCRFRHIVDGEPWTYFDAVAPDDRYGRHPDRLAEAMRRIGLDPDYDFNDYDDEDDNLITGEEPPHDGYWSSMTMALVETVTGLRLDPHALAPPAPTVNLPLTKAHRLSV
ncbi:DUF6461 domain-containing protein [Yinghuangia sp. ASG 101]|uniref:DUF6461 domain-containing protein n=1 Tax=Yinghuangia sp. ASG 101 TaxID=2896848 RepID=UPI001E58903C|nr:DUF6461 domain-containing protein [Yinghuangia sp. ASG 101]UGQ11348.1 DUF6461 domain-containing protein [Yinghuangia sp. ASG 101]